MRPPTFLSAFREICDLFSNQKLEQATTLLDQLEKRREKRRKQYSLYYVYLHAYLALLRNEMKVAQEYLEQPDIPGLVLLFPDLREKWTTERRWHAPLWWLLGNLANHLGQVSDATNHYRLCLSLLEERRMDIPEVHVLACCALGALYQQRGDYRLALLQYQQMLDLSLNPSPFFTLAEIYYHLGDLSGHMRDWSNASFYGSKALDLATPDLKGKVYHLLGQASRACEEWEQAEAYYLQALKYNGTVQVSSRIALARLMLRQGKSEQAWSWCLKTFGKLPKHRDNQDAGTLYLVCGDVSIQRGLLQEAISWYRKALKISQALNDYRKQGQLYRKWSDVLIELGKPRTALRYMKKATNAERHVSINHTMRQ